MKIANFDTFVLCHLECDRHQKFTISWVLHKKCLL